MPLVPELIGGRMFLLSLLLFGPAVACGAAADGIGAAARSDPVEMRFRDEIVPLLKSYCYECHGNGEAEGGFALDDYPAVADVRSDAEMWETVMNYVRTSEMPIKRAQKQPSAAEREAIGAWVESVIFDFDPAKPDPGRVTIRRLNRTEYNNTVRDLVGIDFQPADDFPADNSGYGFDNIADVLSVPPVLMEKYLAAAEKILDAAIPTRAIERRTQRYQANLMERGFNAVGDRGDGWMPLNGLEEDHVATMIDAAAGDYVLRVEAFANSRTSESMKLWLMVDDAVVHEWDVAKGEEAKAVYEARFGVPAGRHRIAVVNRRLREQGPERIQGNGRVGPRQEGDVLVKWVEIEGPVDGATRRFAARDLTPSSDAIGLVDGARVLTREGEVGLTFDVAQQGEFLLRAQAYARKAGEDPARMELRIDGKAAGVFDVLAPAKYHPSASDRIFSMELLDEIPQVYELRATLTPGAKKITAAFINDFADPQNEDPNLRERDLVIEHLEVVNLAGAQPLPERPALIQELFARAESAEAKPSGFWARMFGRQVAPPSDAERARRIVADFTRRAWRRPVTDEEVDGLATLYEAAVSDGSSFEESVKLPMKAALVSPYFLFRGEVQPEPDNPTSVHPVNEFALASRLSYFLWSSMPDEELFDLAARGALRANLAAQVRRMLASPKAGALVRNFAGQWLELRNLKYVEPDKDTFRKVVGTNRGGRPAYRPIFDDGLRRAMQQETEMFFEAVMREDRSVLDFVRGDFTFVNARLAEHYGIAGVEGEAFQRVSLAGTPRRGVLTHASVLTLTSIPTRTSPVKRGKWVLDNLLGTPPPPPPPTVPDLPNDGKPVTGSLRVQMEQHRTNPTCASCHARMDPIGFGLENFDAIGAWRERDGEFPIDASGDLVSGETFAGAVALSDIIATNKRDLFVRCLIEKMLIYALGRGVESFDRPAINRIMAEMQQGNFTFSSLITGITTSAPFQMRRGESPAVASHP